MALEAAKVVGPRPEQQGHRPAWVRVLRSGCPETRKPRSFWLLQATAETCSIDSSVLHRVALGSRTHQTLGRGDREVYQVPRVFDYPAPLRPLRHGIAKASRRVAGIVPMAGLEDEGEGRFPPPMSDCAGRLGCEVLDVLQGSRFRAHPSVHTV